MRPHGIYLLTSNHDLQAANTYLPPYFPPQEPTRWIRMMRVTIGWLTVGRSRHFEFNITADPLRTECDGHRRPDRPAVYLKVLDREIDKTLDLMVIDGSGRVSPTVLLERRRRCHDLLSLRHTQRFFAALSGFFEVSSYEMLEDRE